MSKLSIIQITCPKCGATAEHKVWESVNVTLNPSFREKIFNEELYSWTCPKCSLKATVPTYTLYHDMDRSFVIHYFPLRPGNEGVDPKLLKSPMNKIGGYRYRAVFDIYDFKEKISILESGLDDCTVELLKYMLKHEGLCKNIPEECELRFNECSGIDDEFKVLLFYCVSPGEKNPGILPVKYEMYEDLLKIDAGRTLFAQENDYMIVSQGYLKKIFEESGKK